MALRAAICYARPMIKIIALFLLFLQLAPVIANASEISVSVEFARQGDRVLGYATYAIPEGYHSYANKPGDGGKPTKLDFILEGYGELPVFYPPGVPEKDLYDPDLVSNYYTGETSLLVILPGHAGGKTYAASLDMLLCSARHCLPSETKFTGQVAQNPPMLADTPWQADALALLADENRPQGEISLEKGSAPEARQEAPQPMKRTMAPEPRLDDAPAAPDLESGDFNLGLAPRYIDSDLEIYSFGKAILFGIIAGLLLNAMPCVLPVLTLKVSGLILLGNADDKTKIRDFRLHNIFFATGVFTLFTLLALLLGLADMIWGQLFQNQYVLLGMMLLVFLMGLSMLGVFTLPAFDLRVGQDTRNPLLKSYLTGLVSTFLATPCSGPLLGGVLAWAFAQPLHALVAVFWSVGLGMSLPYILFSAWPRLSRALPKPGNWMGVFEHVLGFLLLATALYLLYILPEEKRIQILAVTLLAAFCAWFWGAFCGLSAPPLRRRMGGLACLCLLCAASLWALRPESPAPEWQDFSPKIFARELGRRDMLVEFTADWCPNCKFLEASVLTDKNLRAWQRKYGMELVRVDLTRSNPYAEDLLGQLGSKSIPLTALFPSGPKARNPLVLRDVYGVDAMKDALRQAF